MNCFSPQISQIFEPFLDLSLPVMEEKPQRPNQILGGRKKDSAGSEQQEESLIEHTDRPSKHLERKLKKQAKKEAKVPVYSDCTCVLLYI
jgi:ubiquitin carboxyl-terminal hydrolase 16/45